MDDVSRVIGRTVIEWNGEELLLDNFGFDDWSALQSWLIREKRGRILKTVLDLKGQVSDEDYEMLYQDALDKVGAISGLTPSEAQDFLNSEEGLAFVLWVMIERRYPGKLKRQDILKLLRTKKVSPEQAADALDAVALAMGSDPAGNSTGQGSEK